MQIKIHRGINQIGGCITEIATSSTRILIDLGQNLPDNEGNSSDPLATKEAVAKLTEGVDVILYTHYHGDHVGLATLVPKGIEQRIGDVAQKVCICKHERLGFVDGREHLSAEEVATFKAMIPMRPAESFTIKDIKITPYWASHSAYESLMFLIEAEGKKIFHTGDFRDHGYLGKGLEKTLRKYIGQVDVLITEGTMLSRFGEEVRTEQKLQEEFKKAMDKYKNVFVISSSTDLERLATIHSAHRVAKPNAPFICDNFQKQLLDIFSSHAAHKEKTGLFNFSDAITFESNTADIWGHGMTMLIRCTDKYHIWLDKLLPKLKQEETCVIFSMWGEYINKNGKHAIKNYLKMVDRFKNIIPLHTSGHASKECLAMVCETVNPRLAIIPIHSENSSDFLNIPISDELKSKVVCASKEYDSVDIII